MDPIEFSRFQDNSLYLEDFYRILLENRQGDDFGYLVSFHDDNSDKVAEDLVIKNVGKQFKVDIPQAAINHIGSYLRIDVHSIIDGEKVPSPAQFHFTISDSDSLKLVGVVH